MIVGINNISEFKSFVSAELAGKNMSFIINDTEPPSWGWDVLFFGLFENDFFKDHIFEYDDMGWVYNERHIDRIIERYDNKHNISVRDEIFVYVNGPAVVNMRFVKYCKDHGVERVCCIAPVSGKDGVVTGHSIYMMDYDKTE